MAHPHFKMVLLGNQGVGKSCLVLRFVREEFYEDQETTIGAAFLVKNLLLGADGPVKLEIWDTAGQERYRSLAPMYYRGASAAVVVFDVTVRESFSGAQSWVKELQKRGDPSITICLVANKCDLTGKRKVEGKEAQEYAEREGLLYIETSARANDNVRECFELVARAVLPKLKAAAAAEQKRDVVSLQQTKPANLSSKKGCCG